MGIDSRKPSTDKQMPGSKKQMLGTGKPGTEMPKLGTGKLIGRYLREKLDVLLLVAACNIVMLTIFFLYRLDMAPFFYAFLLNVFFTFSGLCISFLRYVARHREREKLLLMLENNDYAAIDPQTLEAEDYTRIIELLYQRCNSLLSEHDFQMEDSKDYFTLWVHQIKTPISVLDMLLKDDSQEMRDCRVELLRIEQYVDMVLNYFRLGSNSKDIAYKEVELDGLIKSCIRKYAPLFINKKLKLSYEPVQAKILTDDKWLSFIIEQLLSNAVKYTSEGTVSIEVLDNAIKISDTGIGIRSEDLPRIFEKGYTGFNGRSGSKSSGLGLYLCKLAAERLSLKLSVTSEPGKGSQFYISGLFDKDSGERLE